MKVLLLALLPTLAFAGIDKLAYASKGDVSVQPKMSAASSKGDPKPAPSTDKRSLHLGLKKSL